MSRAIITLVDDPDGAVEMNVTFENGFNKSSHAHGQAELMIKRMDELASSRQLVATEE